MGTNMTIGIDGSNDLSLGSEFTNTTTYVNGTASSAVTLNAWNYIIINSDEITPTTLQFGYVSSSYGAFKLKGFMAFNYALSASDVTYYSNPANHPKVVDQTATGTELITNGTFTSDISGWTNNVTYPWATAEWSAGSAHLYTTGVANYKSFYQTVAEMYLGKRYKVAFTVTRTTGSIFVGVLKGPRDSGIGYSSGTLSSTTSVNTTFTCTLGDASPCIDFQGPNTSTDTRDWLVDNVSLKEAGATLILSPEGMYPGLWRDAYHSIDVSVGTGSTSPRLVKSQAGMNAWRFDGTDDYLTKASAGDGLTGDITIVGWIKPQSITSVSGSSRRIFSNTKTMILIGTAGAIVFYRNGSTSLATANGTIVPETVYYLVITSTSSGTSNIYLNNVLSKTGSNGSPVSSTTYYIGTDAAGVGPFLGIIEGLKIYKRLWSAEEISLGYSLYDD